jgi:hypothetical protein
VASSYVVFANEQMGDMMRSGMMSDNENKQQGMGHGGHDDGRKIRFKIKTIPNTEQEILLVERQTAS